MLAAAVEMIHTATLIHDDVLDEATMRRHLETVNVRWNNETSVLLGDYLFTRVLCLASSLEDVFACQAIGDASRAMCEGELRQVESRGNYGLSEPQYLDIITGKTAALTACCCRLGAHYAGADPAARRPWPATACNLGIAFQIADDLLDVLGDEATVGKSLGTDLLKQKSTLPLIRLLERVEPGRAGGTGRAAFRLRQSPPRDSAQLVGRSDALAYARGKAREFAAVRRRRRWPLFPPGPARRLGRPGRRGFVVSGSGSVLEGTLPCSLRGGLGHPVFVARSFTHGSVKFHPQGHDAGQRH